MMKLQTDNHQHHNSQSLTNTKKFNIISCDPPRFNSKTPDSFYCKHLYHHQFNGQGLESRCNQSNFLLVNYLHEESISQLLTARLWFDWPGVSCDLISRRLIGLPCQTRHRDEPSPIFDDSCQVKKVLNTECGLLPNKVWICLKINKYEANERKIHYWAQMPEIHEGKMPCCPPDGLIQ